MQYADLLRNLLWFRPRLDFSLKDSGSSVQTETGASSIPDILSTIACLTTCNVTFSSSLSGSTLLTSSSLSSAHQILPNATWNSLSLPYNLRLPWAPAIITIPKSLNQVQDAIICARDGGFKVQARSGGHSYAAFGLGGKDGGLIIDLREWNEVVVDAKVGAGVRLGNFALSIYDQGKRAVPHGVCPGVGVGGHFTHGGYGYPSRLWGLALDQITAIDAVLANGTYVHTTPCQHPSLFFAMRGAADSFAIATNFYLQTYVAPDSIVVFTARIPAVLQYPKRAADAFVKLQAMVEDPTFMNANTSMSFYINNHGAFTLRGWCIECDITKFEKDVFSKLLEIFPTPVFKNVTTMGWIAGLDRLADGVPMELPLYTYTDYDTFYSKSIVTSASKPLSYDQWLSFFTFIFKHGRSAPSPWNTIIDLYGGIGSRINRPSSIPSAFSHRDTLWTIQNNANTKNHQPPFTNEIISFIESLTNSVTKRMGEEFGIYLNCADPELTPEEVARRGYGAETYNQLLEIKNAEDPGHLFWNPHSIGNIGSLSVRSQKDDL